MFGYYLRLALGFASFLLIAADTTAHDSWISRGALRNAAGEWCCGEGDPFNETQPSPDGAFWRCKRPDGSRRCFFAPPPNT